MFILENKYVINIYLTWNDKWCSTTSFPNIAGISDGSNIPDTVSQFYSRCLIFLVISWSR